MIREPAYIRQRYRAILSSLGVVFLLSSGVIIAPVLTIFFGYWGEREHALAFILPSAGLAFLGLVLQRASRPAEGMSLSLEEGGVIVLLSWVTVTVFSAFPFMEILGLPFSRALFESVSGWTTTGLSVVDVTTAGPLVLIFRSVMQLAGGAGLAIIMMSAILGPTGTGISAAEGRSDQLVPQVRQSARLVLIVYAGYAAIGTVAYWLAGMSPFDALNHSFCAVSTGGFSTRAESIGYWDSVAVEAVTIPLMILGNMSFVTAWFLLRGNVKSVIRNGEVRVMAYLVPLSIAAVFLFITHSMYPQLSKSVRVAVFESITALTTTGYSTVSYVHWGAFGWLVLIALMLVGGGTCSTAGGLKQFRVYTLAKSISWEVKRMLIPRSAILERPVWEGDRRLFFSDERLRQIAVFVFLYLTLYILGSLVLCASGFSLKDSLFEFASAIGTVGLSVGVTSANMPDTALWAETVAMFVGRLEIFVVIVSVWKIRRDFRLMLTRDPKEKQHA